MVSGVDSPSSRPVLVTGASGFIAQHLTVRLLALGHRVRGTVRSLSSADKIRGALGAHHPSARDLELLEADLETDRGWPEAVSGCSGVYHVASPFPSVLPKNPEDVIRPAREGTLRVLSAAHAAGVPRVVMTSSFAAVGYGWGDARPELLTEEHWSNPDNLTDNTAYTRSKTIAERAAWAFVQNEGQPLELVTINPSVVLGPILSDGRSTSLGLVSQLLEGRLPALPNLGFGFVDVRDVAEAHLRAMELPRAAGERYLLGSEFMWLREVADILRASVESHRRRIPRRKMPTWLVRGVARASPELRQVVPDLDQARRMSDKKAVRQFGLTMRPAREAILATAESLIEKGLV